MSARVFTRASNNHLQLSNKGRLMTKATPRSTSAEYVTAFATGWPENQPHILVMSLTTHTGVQDFAFNKEQALLVAKTLKETADRLAPSK